MSSKKLIPRSVLLNMRKSRNNAEEDIKKIHIIRDFINALLGKINDSTPVEFTKKTMYCVWLLICAITSFSASKCKKLADVFINYLLMALC